MPNLLARSTSPYLLQHKDNPIDWMEWGDEAFARAKAENKPVFVSVGYASCHWCHVMAHESFEDEEVAAFLNKFFVCIKVDREERPDVDEAYMMATQMISGRGGWPMTVFATPDKRPFFAGTYFPKEDRGQYPGFKTLLRQIAGLWQQKPQEVKQSAAEIARTIERALTRDGSSLTSTMPMELVEQCFQAQKGAFDPENGGFGKAPKFPPHTALRFLLDIAPGLPEQDGQLARAMVAMTLQAMALGGIHDHVGGGFSRYSTDEHWLLPHFEKMLYDNALLLGAFARASQEFEERELADLFERAAIGIVGWLSREMTAPNGMFFSAIDADSEGEEGLFYLWSAEELQSLLGARYEVFAAAFGIQPGGNYIDEATRQPTGLNILALGDDLALEFRRELETLFTARSRRERPETDIKCLAAWNGMAMIGLVAAGETMAAERCAQAWLAAEKDHGELPHQVTGGVPSGLAFLDDYAFLALALLDLAEATGNAMYRTEGERLADFMVARFADREKGGFFMASEFHEELFGRSKPAFDQPTPSANSAAIEALVRLERYEEAERHLMAVIGWAQKQPESAEALVRVMLQLSVAQSGTPTPIIEIAAPPKPLGKVTAKLSERELRAGADGWATAVVTLDVPEGLHLNTSNPPARWLAPTRVVAEPVKIEAEYPAGQNDRYEGVVSIPVRLKGDRLPAEFEVRIQFQACTETECQPPTEVVIDGVILG